MSRDSDLLRAARVAELGTALNDVLRDYNALRAGIQREVERSAELEGCSHCEHDIAVCVYSANGDLPSCGSCCDHEDGKCVPVATHLAARLTALLTEPSAGAEVRVGQVWRFSAPSRAANAGDYRVVAQNPSKEAGPDSWEMARHGDGHHLWMHHNARVKGFWTLVADPAPGAAQSLSTLIEAARHHHMTPEEQEAQRQSFVRGNLAIDAPGAAQPDRTAKLEAIRADRIARDGKPDPSREAVVRDVVASSALAGIDARPWVGAAQTKLLQEHASMYCKQSARIIDLEAKLRAAEAVVEAGRILENELGGTMESHCAGKLRERLYEYDAAISGSGAAGEPDEKDGGR